MNQSNEGEWAVIAAYNEENNVRKVASLASGFIKNIVVVDDGSRDRTYNKAKASGAFVLKHIINMGKGAAAKTGCDFAVSKGAKKLVLLDADGQHKPEDIPRFLRALEGKDIVFGYRKFSKRMPLVFRFGNRFINTATSVLFGIRLKDTQCGFRAMTSDSYKKVRWNSADYSMESEMIARSGKAGLKYSEVSVDTIYKSRYKGTTPVDGIKIVLNMLLWRIGLK